MRNLAWTSGIEEFPVSYGVQALLGQELCPLCHEGCHSRASGTRAGLSLLLGTSALVLSQEMQLRARNPSLARHLWGHPDPCCSPGWVCWHCQPSGAPGDGCVLLGNIPECLGPCVGSGRRLGGGERSGGMAVRNGRRKSFEVRCSH